VFDARLRPLKDRLLAPLAALIGHRLSPNTLTVLALVPGLAAAYLAWTGHPGWAVAMWALNRLLDGLDGALARHTDRQSDLGGYLDLVLDFVVYAAVPIGALAGGVAGGGSAGAGAQIALIALLASFYVNSASWIALSAVLEKRAVGSRSMARVSEATSAESTAQSDETTIAMPPGLIGGAETVLFYALLLGLPAAATNVAWVMTVGVAISALQRVWWAVRRLPDLEREASQALRPAAREDGPR